MLSIGSSFSWSYRDWLCIGFSPKKQLILAKAFKNSNYTPPLQLKLEAINVKKSWVISLFLYPKIDNCCSLAQIVAASSCMAEANTRDIADSWKPSWQKILLLALLKIVQNKFYANTLFIALALSKHSSYSCSGTDKAVMALPTEKERYCFFWLYKILRITTLKSKSPSGVK